jgi:hypothetical protein
MRRFAAAAALVFFSILGVGAQDSDAVSLAYRRNFARASLVTKLELIKEASARGGASMGPLYGMAVRFAVDNAVLLAADPQLKELAILAAKEVEKTGYAKAIDDLWALFQNFQDAEVRAAAIAALGTAGVGEARVAENLNAFLASQNSLFRSGAQPEYPALEACIVSLGRLGDGSSFPVLFSAYVAGYSPALAAKATAALSSIKGDYRGYLMRVIAKNPPLEKKAAFAAGMENQNFTNADRGELAEAALTAALDALSAGASLSPVELQAMRDLRRSSAQQIRDLKWQKASSTAARYFSVVQADYVKGSAPKAEFLDAITCLGAMGSTEAAQSLSIYLQLVNAQTEQGAPYDEEILLAVITALGDLGDKAAFDYLLQTGYLQYGENIKRAARDSMLKLRW